VSAWPSDTEQELSDRDEERYRAGAALLDRYVAALDSIVETCVQGIASGLPAPKPVCVYADELGICEEPREGARYCAGHRAYETCEHGVSLATACLACEPPLDPLALVDDYDENAADDRFYRYG